MLSIALMGFAAALVAALLQRHPWISYAGLVIVLYVALKMIWFGGVEIYHASSPSRHPQQQRGRVVAFLEARELAAFGIGVLDRAQFAAQRGEPGILRGFEQGVDM